MFILIKRNPHHVFTMLLVSLTVTDMVLTWVLWNSGLMEEGNPLVLKTLETGGFAYFSTQIMKVLGAIFVLEVGSKREESELIPALFIILILAYVYAVTTLVISGVINS